MVDVSELRGIIAKQGLSQRQVAKSIGITEKTFYAKMERGVFKSNEIEQMILVLDIKDPCRIFFAKDGT